jgi:hypothetical protein
METAVQPNKAEELGRVHAAEVFGRIYASREWGGVSASGPGSSIEACAVLIQRLPGMLANLEVRSLLDIPCGDFHWMQHVVWRVEYIGADIVPEMIEANKVKHARPGVAFMVADITSDQLPACDLLFCRDALVHMPLADCVKAIENIKRSGATYLLCTTFAERTSNPQSPLGSWRPLNMELAPFNFPASLIMIDEGKSGEYADKSMGLWMVGDLP